MFTLPILHLVLYFAFFLELLTFRNITDFMESQVFIVSVPVTPPGHRGDNPPVLSNLPIQPGENSPFQLIVSLDLLYALVVVAGGVSDAAVEVTVTGDNLLVVRGEGLLHHLLVVSQTV